MCSHYEAPSREQLVDAFGLEPEGQYEIDLWPGRTGVMIRNLVPEGDEPVETVASTGVFGLLPFWAKGKSYARNTYNARCETVATLNSYRDAWKKSKHCIIPAAAIYEPDWRPGKPRPARISRNDGRLLGIAGLWETWKDPAGEQVHSFTMLTINADGHEVMQNYHKPGAEKRMVVILPAGAYRDWLSARPEESREFLMQYPADRLQGVTQEPE